MGLPAAGFSSGEAMALMEQIATKASPPGIGYEWTAMSYQEKLVRNQIYYIFAFSMLLVGTRVSIIGPITTRMQAPLAERPLALPPEMGGDHAPEAYRRNCRVLRARKPLPRRGETGA
jgi:hypothetical protein